MNYSGKKMFIIFLSSDPFDKTDQTYYNYLELVIY